MVFVNFALGSHMTVAERVRRLVVLALLAAQIPLLTNKQLPAATQETTGTTWVKVLQDTSPAIVVIETETGLGSGFFVNSNGTVVTNHHVIADAKEITIKLSSGEAYRRAYLLSKDETRDIDTTGIPSRKDGLEGSGAPDR